jgi:hypothetical protein
MLDLDVGFLSNPLPIIDTFISNPIADIVVQEARQIFQNIKNSYNIFNLYIFLGFNLYYEPYKSWLEDLVY